MKKMSKRTLARIISFLTAGILSVSLLTAGAIIKAKEFERKSEAMYQKSLAEANEYLSDMDTVLLKGLYSQSRPAQCSMCAELWMDAYEAKNAISSLPISEIDMEKCYSYLSKVAEYSKACEKKIASGEKLTNEDHQAFLSIKSKTDSLAKSFEKIQKIYLGTGEKISGGIDFSFAVPRTISSSHATSEGLNAMNKNLSDAPKLIYDGPYSDNINTKDPEMLKGEKKIDIEKATEIAEKFLREESGVLSFNSLTKGNIPSYSFKKGNCYLLVSQKGGKIVSFNSSSSASKTAFDEKDCLNIAENYLKKLGYDNMKCDYYEKNDNTLILNFHYLDGEVNVYTDLIKMKLNCENGKVIGFDCASFLTNHTGRKLDFKLSAKQCQSAVSPYLKIKDIKKSLIPTESEKEALCYEYRTITPEGNELLVFIDAGDGKEKDILILQIGENSVLTK